MVGTLLLPAPTCNPFLLSPFKAPYSLSPHETMTTFYLPLDTTYPPIPYPSPIGKNVFFCYLLCLFESSYISIGSLIRQERGHTHLELNVSTFQARPKSLYERFKLGPVLGLGPGLKCFNFFQDFLVCTYLLLDTIYEEK